MTKRHTLTLSCPDRVGIVAAVKEPLRAAHVVGARGSYHTDLETQLLFMRHTAPIPCRSMRRYCARASPRWPPTMTWQVSDSGSAW